jgi:hypothetical protein
MQNNDTPDAAPNDPPKLPGGKGVAAGNEPTARWSPSGVGSFSGIDYSQAGAIDGLDPYFVWTDIGGFAHLRKPGQKPGDTSHVPTWLPLLIALTPGSFAAQLSVEGNEAFLVIADAYLQTSDVPDLVVPARATAEFFKRLKSDPALAALVQSVELDLPREALLTRPAEKKPPLVQYASAARAGAARLGAAPAKLQGKVMAFIDDGCAFAHPHFLQGSAQNLATLQCRIKRLWDQNERHPASPHAPPSGFTDGRELTDADLKVFIANRADHGRTDEDGVYADFAAGTLHNTNRLLGRMAHGTHIMDLASGPYFLQDTMCSRFNAPAGSPSWEAAQDAASGADIIFVQLPMRTVQDTSGRGTMTSDVVNALKYIVSQCDSSAQIVVNLSWGTLAGPHNGTSVLERAIDDLINNLGGRLQVAVPAGNGYQSRTHANFTLAPGASQTLRWRTQPDDATESYLELWFEQGVDLQMHITLPDGRVLPAVNKGFFYKYAEPFHDPSSLLGVYYPSIAPHGETGQCILLAVAPTVSLQGTRPVAPHGVWQITVTNVSAMPAVIDGYIERDDVALGTRRGARQSYFDDPRYDRVAKEDGVRVSDTSAPALTYVRREGVFNAIATGARIVRVGGVRDTDLAVADYSPHDMYSLRSARADTRPAMHYYASTEESKTLHGVRAAGTRSSSTVRLSGTSDAAPQIARDLFNALP